MASLPPSASDQDSTAVPPTSTSQTAAAAAAAASSANQLETYTVIKLHNGMVLYSRGINKFLSLVCLLREDNYDSAQGTIEYNFTQFRQSILDVLDSSLSSSYSSSLDSPAAFNNGVSPPSL